MTQSGPQVRYVFGTGTGRCGTVSLARMLDAADRQVTVSHELVYQGSRVAPLVPWDAPPGELRRALKAIDDLGGCVRGDVASFWLPHIPELVSTLGQNARFVVLWRERDAVVNSFLKRVGPRNHWVAHRGVWWAPSPFDVIFPKFERVSRRAAVGRYWDLCWELGEEYADRYPEQVILKHYLDALNPSGFEEICRFVGIEDPQYAEVVANRSRESSLLKRWLRWQASRAYRSVVRRR